MPIDEISGCPENSSCWAPSTVRNTLAWRASKVESSTTPTICNVREPISRFWPTPRPIVLDTAISPGLVGTRPADTAGIPGAWSGGPDPVAVARPTAGGDRPAAIDHRYRGCDARGPCHCLQFCGRERRRSHKRPRRARLDQIRVEAQRVDGPVRLHAKSVGQPGQNKCHREDQPGADDGDDESPLAPLQVAQRRGQHVVVPRMCRTLPTITYCRAETGSSASGSGSIGCFSRLPMNSPSRAPTTHTIAVMVKI